ncbi:MAG: VWA domain-containing protein, partial [Caldilineae bacterium]
MTFGNPWALLLLGLAPLLLFISRGRLIHLSPLRRRLALALRLLLLVLLVLALADARRLRSADDLSVVFLVDVSDSMPPAARETALAFIRDALQAKPPDDTVGVIAFGANALVEELPRRNLPRLSLDSTPNPAYTNFADAIRLGMALFPAEAPKRLVLLSDGQNNLGDARAAARLAAAAGIELDALQIEAPAGPEVRLSRLDAPGTLHQSERFDLSLTVESNTATQTEVQLFADGQLVARQTVNLQAGENRFVFPMVAGEQGFSTFRARLVPAADTRPQNNRLDAFSRIEGPLRVLLVSARPAEGEALRAALEAAGLQVEPVAPPQMPADPLTLSEYAAVVLVNVPAPALSPAQLSLLQVYVRDLGGGLVAVGGPESYGAGGYFQTPLEETLPVNMALKDRERLPGMTMLMVIDKSGSMASAGTQGMGGPRKVELAKEAIYRAVDLLAPWDRVGVVAFDNAARWVVNPVPVVDVPAIKDAVGTIRASGGTDILAGLQAAAGAMTDETSRVRHIVLLTDGGADPTGIPELVDNLVAEGVSVSVVAIGDDYAPFLEDVARRGNGRFHFARDAATIPQIFAQEAVLALKAYLIEEEFTPRLTAASPILQGIPALPNLFGYVATEPKQTAQTVLVSERDDPLLAQWQYGLGRSVAFTSDATGRWGKAWVGWADFARFWGQAVRWTIVEGAAGNLEARVTADRERGV